MHLVREGPHYLTIAALAAAAAYVVALNRRSWMLWLLAFALTIVALGVAWSFRPTPGTLRDAAAPGARPANERHPVGAAPTAGSTVIAELAYR